MSVRLAGLMLAIWASGAGLVFAQGVTLPEYPRFVFPTTPEISIKLQKSSNAKPIRGKLISLTSREAVVDTGNLSRRDRERGELGQRIGFDRIESLRSTDGRLEFQPSEDFRIISERIVAAYASVVVEPDAAPGLSPSVSSSLPLAPPGIEGQGTTFPVVPPRPRPGQPAVNGLGQGGFGGLSNLPKSKKPEPAVIPLTAAPESTPHDVGPEVAHAAASKPVASEILSCSNCGKDLPASATQFGICPHCKVTFTLPPSATSNAVQNPFQQSGGGAFDPTSTGASVGAPAPTTNTGTQVVQGGGFSFDAVPNWAKGGLFALLVLVGYHLLYNR